MAEDKNTFCHNNFFLWVISQNKITKFNKIILVVIVNWKDDYNIFWRFNSFLKIENNKKMKLIINIFTLYYFQIISLFFLVMRVTGSWNKHLQWRESVRLYSVSRWWKNSVEALCHWVLVCSMVALLLAMELMAAIEHGGL